MEERKSNKKTRGIIIAAMVLLLVAIMCLCGTTFAKYITSTSVPTQQATVAKWGFTVTANTDKLFAKQYNAGEVVATDASKIDVKAYADATKNVVAPGTSGSMTITVKGKAEVDAKMDIAVPDSVTAKDISLKWTPKGDGATEQTYAPIVWKLTIAGTVGETDKASTTTGSLDDCITAINTSEALSAGTEVDLTYTLTWTWAFDDDSAVKATVPAGADRDVLDTILGTIAGTTPATTTTTIDDVVYTAALDIEFALNISVEQTQNEKEVVGA